MSQAGIQSAGAVALQTHPAVVPEPSFGDRGESRALCKRVGHRRRQCGSGRNALQRPPDVHAFVVVLSVLVPDRRPVRQMEARGLVRHANPFAGDDVPECDAVVVGADLECVMRLRRLVKHREFDPIAFVHGCGVVTVPGISRVHLISVGLPQFNVLGEIDLVYDDANLRKLDDGFGTECHRVREAALGVPGKPELHAPVRARHGDLICRPRRGGKAEESDYRKSGSYLHAIISWMRSRVSPGSASRPLL